MNQNVKNEVSKKVQELISASSCCAEAKAAGQRWLDALDTPKEAEETKNLIAELEMDLMPIDGLLAFASSEAGAQVFGAETAKNVAAHAQQLKDSGIKYCACPACTAVEAILAKKDELLA